MRRFFYKILLISGLVFSILSLFGLLAQKQTVYKLANLPFNGYGNSFTRFREADTVSEVDILVIGSSHAYRSFDPRIFKESGIKLFNLGSSSQSHIQTKRLLDIYLTRIKPKLIIYEVFYSIFNTDGLESQYDLIANLPDNNANPLLSLQYFNLKLIAFETLNLLKYKLGFNEINKAIYQVDTDNYITGGYCERIKETKNLNLNFEKISFNPNKEQVNAFKENIEFIKLYNIPVFLIHAPIPINSYRKFDNKKVFFDFISSFGTLINGNELLGNCLNDTLHFYDNNHLNQVGVQLFNNELLTDDYLNPNF